MSRNHLVDPKSTIDWNAYRPGLDPYTNRENPDDGIALWDDLATLEKDVARGESDIDFGLDAVTAGLDAVNSAVDPFGALLSAGVGWLLEHVKPLKFYLDILTGQPEVITARRDTWSTIGAWLKDTAEGYRMSIAPGTSAWQGEAADAYRVWANGLAPLVGAAGSAAAATSEIIKVAHVACLAARSLIRGLIATLVSEFVKWGIEMALTRGASLPKLIEEAKLKIAQTASKCTQILIKLATFISRNIGKLARVWTLLQAELKMLEHFENAKSHAPR